MTGLRWLLPFVPLGIGTTISGYLFYRSLQLTSGAAEFGVSLCSAYLGADCDTALIESATWVGIPIAGWGVVYFIFMACLLALGRMLGGVFTQVAIAVTLTASAIGLGISAWLVWLLASGRAPSCPLCYVTHGINLFFVATILAQDTARPSKLPGLFLTAYIGLFSDREESSSWNLVGVFCAGLVGLAAFQWMLVQSDRAQMQAELSSERAQRGDPEFAFIPGDAVEIPVTDADPQIGPADAPIQLVVFSSFQCPGCQAFARILPTVQSAFSGELRIVFKHFPLGSECNPHIPENDFQPQSCAAAHAAQAAHQQGKFWEYHDLLFESDLGAEDDALQDIAKTLGLDMAAFETARQSDEVAAQVRHGVDLGDQFGIPGTPAVFVNGRRLRAVDQDVLLSVIYNLHGSAADLP